MRTVEREDLEIPLLRVLGRDTDLQSPAAEGVRGSRSRKSYLNHGGYLCELAR